MHFVFVVILTKKTASTPRKEKNNGSVDIAFSLFSSVAWSAYHKGVLASSDYEGTIALWDVFQGVKTKLYQVRLNLPVTFII